MEITDGDEECKGNDDEEHACSRHPKFFLFTEVSLLVPVNEQEGEGEGTVHRAVQPRHFLPADDCDEDREREHDQEESVLALFLGTVLCPLECHLRFLMSAYFLQLFRHVGSLLSLWCIVFAAISFLLELLIISRPIFSCHAERHRLLLRPSSAEASSRQRAVDMFSRLAGAKPPSCTVGLVQDGGAQFISASYYT